MQRSSQEVQRRLSMLQRFAWHPSPSLGPPHHSGSQRTISGPPIVCGRQSTSFHMTPKRWCSACCHAHTLLKAWEKLEHQLCLLHCKHLHSVYHDHIHVANAWKLMQSWVHSHVNSGHPSPVPGNHFSVQCDLLLCSVYNSTHRASASNPLILRRLLSCTSHTSI